MAEEKRVRVVLEAVGGSQAADDAARFKEELSGIAQAEDAGSAATEELRARLQQLSSQVAALQQAQQRGQQTQQQFTQAQAQASLKAIELTQKIAAASQAIAGMASQLGGEGASATAGLIGRLAAGAAQGASMGAALGPQGALVGGILGAAIPALQQLMTQQDAAAEAARRHREEIDQLRESLMAQRLEADVAGALADPQMAAAILGSLPEDTVRQQRDIAMAQAREADRRASQLRARARAGDALSDEDIEIAQGSQVRAAQERMRLLDAELERRARLTAQTREQTEAQGRLRAVQSEQDLADRQRAEASRAAEERYQREQDAWERYNASVLSGLQAEESARTRRILQMIETANKARAEADAIVEAIQREKAARDAVEAERRDREARFADESLARLQREVRQQAERDDALERAAERRAQDLQVFADFAGGVSASLVTAVSEIASGAKSAEDAFKGMLASFLTSIAERALIEAMAEYAAAIGSFARYDFGSGAGHVAAGLAWTGVAVATGAAAGAVSAPPSQQQADRPDRTGPDAGEGGRTVFVNNWNAPMVAAGTEADVGRTLDRLGRRATQRYARLAA